MGARGGVARAPLARVAGGARLLPVHGAADVAVRDASARRGRRPGRPLPRDVDSVVGLPPDLPRPLKPLPREHVLPAALHAGLQRALLGTGAPSLSALRFGPEAADGSRRGDVLRLRALGLRRVPPGADADRLAGRRVGRRDSLRVRALPLSPDVAARLPLLAVAAA